MMVCANPVVFILSDLPRRAKVGRGKALFDEEDRVKKLQQTVTALEKHNKQLRNRVKKVKRSLRQARKNARHVELINQKLSEKLSAAGSQLP
ncbi:UNVERIFIED_CONTAM: hypothetical protein K2H54_055297 [Gekko kuhli]